MGKVGQYFSASEVACPCCKETNPSQNLVSILDETRRALGVPLRISSGLRCPARNKAVGGASLSGHLPRDGGGYAADVTYSDHPKRHGEHILRLYIEIENVARRRGINYGLGLYSSWCHIDTRGECGGGMARWSTYNWPR